MISFFSASPDDSSCLAFSHIILLLCYSWCNEISKTQTMWAKTKVKKNNIPGRRNINVNCQSFWLIQRKFFLFQNVRDQLLCSCWSQRMSAYLCNFLLLHLAVRKGFHLLCLHHQEPYQVYNSQLLTSAK